MIRIKNFFKWLLMGSAWTSGDRNFQIAATGAKFAPDGGTVYRENDPGFRSDGGTVMAEVNEEGYVETAEECSRRLKRERDRRYKANKKAKAGGFSLPVTS